MISLLILTHNHRGVTARGLRSLAPTLARPDVEWRILDNASTDGTPAWLLRMAAPYPGRVHVTLSAANLGVAGGRQALLDQAQGETLVFLDNDVVAVDPAWLDRLLAALAPHDVALAGPAGHWLSADWWHYLPVDPGYVGPVDVVSGYCQAFKREAQDGFQMDPVFNPYYAEDSDHCLWLRSRGWTIWCTGEIGIQHVYSGTNADDSVVTKQQYLAGKWAGKGLVCHECQEAYAPAAGD